MTTATGTSRVRPYTEEDFEGVVAVIKSIEGMEPWPQVFPNGWPRERIEKEFAPVPGYQDHAFLVYEREGAILGVVAGHPLSPFAQNEVPHLWQVLDRHRLVRTGTFYQRDLAVHGDHQRSVVGPRLVRALERHAVENGYDTMVTRTPIINERGVAFLGRCNYRELLKDTEQGRVYLLKSIAP